MLRRIGRLALVVFLLAIMSSVLTPTGTIAANNQSDTSLVKAGDIEDENTLYLFEYHWGDRCYGIRSASEAGAYRNNQKDVDVECHFDTNAEVDTTLYAEPEVTNLGQMEDGEIYFYFDSQTGDRCFVTREEDGDDTALDLECHFE